MQTQPERPPRPFGPADQFSLRFQGLQYYPGHRTTEAMNAAVSQGNLPALQTQVSQWLQMQPPSPPLGPEYYPLGPIEPVFYHAIRESRGSIVEYLLQQGIQMCTLAVWEAVEHNVSTDVWQAFVDSGWNINEPLGTKRCPPLG